MWHRNVCIKKLAKDYKGMTNIIVAGGGTAGWLTSLYAKKYYPNAKVYVIENSNIGILGAGEGVTCQMISALQSLDISIQDVIRETGSTIKNGVKFTNWSNTIGKEYYYHSFFDIAQFNKKNFSQIFLETNSDIDLTYVNKEVDKLDNTSFCLTSQLCEKNKIPFILKNENNNIVFENMYASFSIHFDASMMAKFLKKIALSRGVMHIDANINNFIFSEYGNIDFVVYDNNFIRSDFVFDCTGFARLIIGNKFNSEWNSHQDSLTTNRAIPFFPKIDKKIPPYTECVAMNYGWLWRVPLQHRYGSGYVFNSNMISEDDAKKELENFVGYEIESPKTFSFDAGFYERVWINNCLAIGLSSGFIEPLEGSSIWLSINNLNTFFNLKNSIYEKNENIKNIFNKKNKQSVLDVVNFIYLHYVTNKNNTEFWTDYLDKNKMPDFIKNLLEISKTKIPTFEDIGENNLFSYPSYIRLLFAKNLIDKEVVKKYYEKKLNDNQILEINYIINNSVNSCIDHNKFLDMCNE